MIKDRGCECKRKSTARITGKDEGLINVTRYIIINIFPNSCTCRRVLSRSVYCRLSCGSKLALLWQLERLGGGVEAGEAFRIGPDSRGVGLSRVDLASLAPDPEDSLSDSGPSVREFLPRGQ